jgi:hypothetical protein
MRPHGDAMDDWLDVYGGSIVTGGVIACGFPWELNDEETIAEQNALVDALEKKRPVGFAPWPKDLS